MNTLEKGGLLWFILGATGISTHYNDSSFEPVMIFWVLFLIVGAVIFLGKAKE